MAEFVRVAALGDIAAGQGKTVEVNGRQIAVFNCDGELFAIDNACKHQGGPLGEGELDGKTVLCPLHGWAYDVRSGECLEDADCAVDTFEVRIEGGDVLVKA